MQRVHLNDLSGYLMENSEDWTILSLPAIAEQDETVAIGDGKFHLRRAGEALHPELESLESLRAPATPDRFRCLRGAIPAMPSPAGRGHDSARVAPLL